MCSLPIYPTKVIVDHSTNRTTTGKITSYQGPPFVTSSVHGSPATNGDLNVTLHASHSLTIEADVTSGSGDTTHVVWQQNLQYRNLQIYRENATIQVSNGLSQTLMRVLCCCCYPPDALLWC